MNRPLPWSLTVLFLAAASPLQAADPNKSGEGWKTTKTVELKGLKVSLSSPVLVARSQGYLWFPTLYKLADGNLLALMSDYADMHTTTSTSMASWSSNGGLTWTKPTPGQYGDSGLRLPSGDE